MFRLNITFFALGLCLSGLTFSQSAQSTYSSLGIGDLSSSTLIHNEGMGGLGISRPSYWYLNNMNPALLPKNTLTIFEAAIVGEFKRTSNATQKENNSTFNLAYLATAFPIKPGKWTLSLGMMPYSRVNFDFQTTGTIENSNVTSSIRDEGTGGFNQIFIGNGFQINDNLSIGFKSYYLFSSIIKESSVFISDTTIFSSIVPSIFNRVSVSDFNFQGGIAYSKTLNSNLNLSVGLVYDLSQKITAKEFETLKLNNQFGTVVATDTLIANRKGKIKLPESFQLGVSINNGFKWSAGIEAKIQNWSNYRNLESSNDNLDRSYSIRVGGEVVPNPNSADNYFERISYRLGFNYDKTPYVYNGSRINEIGINFGWSLPVSRISSVDFAFKLGQRGSTDDGLVKEEFFRFYFGMTFNDRWFVRRKYN